MGSHFRQYHECGDDDDCQHSECDNDAVQRSVYATMRNVVTNFYDAWLTISRNIVTKMHWYPRVEPYMGYGTERYIRLSCRTIFAPAHRYAGLLIRGIRSVFLVSAPHVHVSIAIDKKPIIRIQIGNISTYDLVGSVREQSPQYAISDSRGYLDLVVDTHLTPGKHEVEYMLPNRQKERSQVFIVPKHSPIGVISDIDDTILVTQVPRKVTAARNMLFSNPRKRMSVPGMAVFYTQLSSLFGNPPFFYLSASPWNVEASIRHFIENYGFPEGPLLLRSFDPTPTHFVQSSVNHKLEFTRQLMNDFPDMKFILIGDDGQEDPTIYATIARQYPNRVLAIGIRQVNGHIHHIAAHERHQVPVFYGSNGVNLMKTMIPYLQSLSVKR